MNFASVYSGVTIEDEVFVGPSAVFTNDRYARAGRPGWVLVPTLVRLDATIGANATILGGVTIGEWATIATGAVVTRDADAHHLVVGSPARRWSSSAAEAGSQTTSVRPSRGARTSGARSSCFATPPIPNWTGYIGSASS